MASMDSPFSETTTTTFEWKLSGLKKIFESSKGETKSKVTRSLQFGGAKWQILFYPNSGTEGGTHVSLYLSCEPTTEEKDRAVAGKWVRDGLFKFSFELRNIAKTVLFNSKEACDHSFSYKTANWGWAQFARRDMVYYQANSVKQADAFMIICVIQCSPFTPSPPPLLPLQSVPCELMDSIGDLLNDPLYSDVEFILPSPKDGKSKKIYAMKRLLVRTDYFDIMLNTGFAESDDNRTSSDPTETLNLFPSHPADDSDYDDDVSVAGSDNDSALESEMEERLIPQQPATLTIRVPEEGESDLDDSSTNTNTTEREEESEGTVMVNNPENSTENGVMMSLHPSADALSVVSWPSTLANNDVEGSMIALPSPVPEMEIEEPEVSSQLPRSSSQKRSASVPGPPKVKIVVRDVAYRTYYAMLHYLYTDSITFAPLASTFSNPKIVAAALSLPSTGCSTPLQTPALVAPASAKNAEGSSSQSASLQAPPPNKQTHAQENPPPPGPRSRKEWLKEWRSTHEDDVVEPCSAKAMYKLADKLDLTDLKNRASKHIVKSMTTHNVPHEMFSSFSAKFDDIRKVQVEYFLAHWSEIRGSDAMKNVWQQIRVGRHPGFEEVWPLIAMNLEFKPSPHTEDSGDEHDGVHDS